MTTLAVSNSHIPASLTGADIIALHPQVGASFTLSGPSGRADPMVVPVRGDLAHIRMAGKVFVPHYVIPMPHVVRDGGASLLRAMAGETLATLEAGAPFHVLDMSGGYAWGEIPGGEIPEAAMGAAIGYIALDRLETVA